MKRISWQSRTPVVFEAVQSGQLTPGANGGNAYDFYAAMALKEEFDLHMDEAAVMKKSDTFLSYWWRMARHIAGADVIICEPAPIVFGKRNSHAKTVAMIHHIDDELAGSSARHGWFFNRLKKRLAGVDLVVTVSKYWETYLRSLGCRRIKIIYNSFDVPGYNIPGEEVEAFRKKNNLSAAVPLVYLGNAHRSKGVYEAYQALKGRNYQFVTTGVNNHAADLPVKFLSLGTHDYKVLLKASSLVVTLSRMTEGWNRIAHEALLSKTPVIGSGSGGMKELLDGAGQPVIKDPQYLAEAVEKVLSDRAQYAESGYSYVKQFDNHYFKTEWKKTIRELTEA
jgi:glycosyltransferase involved in cell wall biosynthesis